MSDAEIYTRVRAAALEGAGDSGPLQSVLMYLDEMLREQGPAFNLPDAVDYLSVISYWCDMVGRVLLAEASANSARVH